MQHEICFVPNSMYFYGGKHDLYTYIYNMNLPVNVDTSSPYMDIITPRAGYSVSAFLRDLNLCYKRNQIYYIRCPLPAIIEIPDIDSVKKRQEKLRRDALAQRAFNRVQSHKYNKYKQNVFLAHNRRQK